jgi:hypothetical protein
VLPTFRVCISTLISNYKSQKCRVKHRDLIQFNRLALSFRIRTSPKLKNSLSGKHFTRYLSTHQLNPTLTNAADTDGWVLSNFYEIYKTLSQLLTNLFHVFPPPISKIAQISLGGITSPHTSPTTHLFWSNEPYTDQRGRRLQYLINVTRQSYDYPALYTIPPIEISAHFSRAGEFQPTSPPP